MKFRKTKLEGVFIIEIEPIIDKRGFFARSFCRKEFRRIGLNPGIKQCNISYNKKAGTLRGMHYQAYPYGEEKLVSCLGGSIYDVAVDLRPKSKTYREWIAVELNSYNYKMLYIPKGFAHGFQALKDDTVVLYQMFESFNPGYDKGIRWNDPVLNIKWPISKKVISEKDKSYPDLR